MQKLTPPAPAGVAENNSSPVEELEVIALWCTLTFMLWQYGSITLAIAAFWQEPGSRIGRAGGSTQIRRREFALADVDAAGERSGVVVYAVVGDLQVMTPGVDEDAAAALGTVADAQTVDAGRIAQEVARERVVCRCGVRIRSRCVGLALPVSRVVPAGKVSAANGFGREPDALGEHGDGRAFQSAHQGGLLQQLGQVAVEGCIPSHHCFQRQAVYLRIGCGWRVKAERAGGWRNPQTRSVGVPLSARPNRQFTLARQASSLPAG